MQNAATLLEINSYSTHYLIHSSSVIEEESLISYDAGKKNPSEEHCFHSHYIDIQTLPNYSLFNAQKPNGV